jgi:hypothetical protein
MDHGSSLAYTTFFRWDFPGIRQFVHKVRHFVHMSTAARLKTVFGPSVGPLGTTDLSDLDRLRLRKKRGNLKCAFESMSANVICNEIEPSLRSRE